MSYLSNKKAKPQFSLKPIENSNLFQRRVNDANCHTDNVFSRRLLINYTLSQKDKITNTETRKNADTVQSKSTRIQSTSEIDRNMETHRESQGKAVKIEITSGLA